MSPVDEAARDRLDRVENQQDAQQKMLHTVDKKVDVMMVGVNSLTESVTKLNTTMETNAVEGRKRHEKADKRNKWNPIIIVGGISAVLTALEAGTLKPVIAFLATLSGIGQ